MASDTKNVKLGVCLVSFDGVDLGYTKGGVEVEVKTETKKVMVDQFGQSEINEFILGRTCSAKVPLAETTIENLIRIMPGATLTATGGAKATGTVTFATAIPANNDKVTVNGVDFTFKTGVSSSPHDISLTGITTVADAAAALAAAVKNSVDPRTMVLSASAVGGVVTLTANVIGTIGNSYTLAKTGSNITVSGATLTGGTAATRMKAVVTNAIGYSLLEGARKLILHPIANAATDRSGDFTIPLAGVGGDLQFAFKLDEERIYVANFVGYPDPVSKTLFIVGDEGAV
jgi:hypothetical protein